MHHGLPEEHMRRACEWVCCMRTADPRPAGLIPDATRRPGPPIADGAAGDDGPGYGTGIDWNEFHIHTRYPDATG